MTLLRCGLVRRVSQLRAQAYAADEDPFEGAIGAAAALAIYLGARSVAEPVALFVTTRQPIPDYRDPLSEVGTFELDPAGAAAAKRTIADAVRRYLGNPFAGTQPTVSSEEVDRVLAIAPTTVIQEDAEGVVAVEPLRPPTGRRTNRVMLAEAEDFVLEEVVLSRTGLRTLRVEWLSYDYNERRREQRTWYRSARIRSATDLLLAISELADASEDRFTFRDAREEVVDAVRHLDAFMASELDAAWRIQEAQRTDDDWGEQIEFVLGRVLEFGGSEPEQWGITRDLRVAPLPLEPVLTLAELEHQSQKWPTRNGTPPEAWTQIVREWLKSGAVLQSEV